MYVSNALWGVVLLCVFGLLSPGIAQDAGDGDPGGGSETTESDNRPEESNDFDDQPTNDEDFGDTWEPEPGTGETVDDGDVPGRLRLGVRRRRLQRLGDDGEL